MDKTFVSRGGIKLQAAIEKWRLDVNMLVCLDVGSSTGGFVDCLLQNGAAKVYAVDTSYGELAWKLRKDPRVVVLERTNILHPPDLPQVFDLITVDAGWTKLEKVIPEVKKLLKHSGIIIALLKPQYETSQEKLEKGVLSDKASSEIKDVTISNLKRLEVKIEEIMESPIRGRAGNKEYLLKLIL